MTTAPNLSEHPWMEHAETGHRAQLPDMPYWRANGWSPVEGPPPEPDLTKDPLLRDPEAPAADEAPGLSAAQTKKATKSAVKPAQAEEEA